jgi:polyvinyl alcohol dehydrogenase (cytochrome)
MRHTTALLVFLLGFLPAMVGPGPATREQEQAASVSEDPNDWPMYNRDVIGTRHNPGEKALGKENVAQLVQKWRFPPAGSEEKVGVVHATVVVNGYVYCGTETFPTLYKLTPDGQVKWAYRPDPPKGPAPAFGLPTAGFMNAALVTSDTVYVGDVGGTIYALDRATGQERWKINTRMLPFPGAHPSHCIFAAPILAEDKVIVAGGGFEHGVAADPSHRCCTGRGFVVALQPRTGKVLWKYDVGPEPQKLDPPVTIKDAWGEHVFHFGPSTSSVWCTPSYDADTRTIFFGTDTHNAPRQPTKDDPKLYTKHSCAVIAVDARTGQEKWVTQINPGDVWNYAMRGYDPATGLYKDQSIGDTPKIYFLMINGRRVRVIAFGCKNGGLYIVDAETGRILFQTPVYTGPPVHPRLRWTQERSLCRAPSGACRRAAPRTARRFTPTASTCCAWERSPTHGNAFSRRPAAGWCRSAWTRSRRIGDTSGRRSRRSAAPRTSPPLPMSATRSPRASLWPTAWRISQRR